jgi:hypothetical protein
MQPKIQCPDVCKLGYSSGGGGMLGSREPVNETTQTRVRIHACANVHDDGPTEYE